MIWMWKAPLESRKYRIPFDEYDKAVVVIS